MLFLSGQTILCANPDLKGGPKLKIVNDIVTSITRKRGKMRLAHMNLSLHGSCKFNKFYQIRISLYRLSKKKFPIVSVICGGLAYVLTATSACDSLDIMMLPSHLILHLACPHARCGRGTVHPIKCCIKWRISRGRGPSVLLVACVLIESQRFIA